MRLRTILLVLSLLAFFSASTAGYLYFSSSRYYAMKEADSVGAIAAETLKDRISSQLNEHMKSARALSGMAAVKEVFLKPEDEAAGPANEILDHFHKALEADVCYLMDSEGYTVASSNRNDPDSFVGENYGFRPYFKQAMEGRPSLYMAQGVTSKRRGLYYSHPVYTQEGHDSPSGVLVIKAQIDLIEREFLQTREGTVALVEPGGLIFISNRLDWLFHFLWKPKPEEEKRIVLSRQLGRVLFSGPVSIKTRESSPGP